MFVSFWIWQSFSADRAKQKIVAQKKLRAEGRSLECLFRFLEATAPVGTLFFLRPSHFSILMC